jgi:glutamyl-tRNA reductase
MALNCIVVSGSGRIPEQIELYLAEARFFEVLAVVKNIAEARKGYENTTVHYYLMDQKTALDNFNALLTSENKQVLIFGAEEVFYLENLKEDLGKLFNPSDVPFPGEKFRESEVAAVDIGLEAMMVRDLKAETPANAPVNILVKARKAQFISQEVKRPIESIFVRSDSRISRIRLTDLLYVEAQKDYVVFHTATNSYRALNSMKKIERHLGSDSFFRLHRSFIVRLDKINTIQGDEVLLDGNDLPVPIGPSYKNKLMKRLELL